MAVTCLEALTKQQFYGFVILSAAKNLSFCGLIETLRCAQGDKGKVLLECFRQIKKKYQPQSVRL